MLSDGRRALETSLEGGRGVGKTYDALTRAERNREARPLQPRARDPEGGVPRPPGSRSLWQRWRARRTVATLERAREHAALLDRLGSIERRLDAFDEALTKKLTEIENRLLHVTEIRLGGYQKELSALIEASVSEATERNTRQFSTRITLALAVILALLVVFLVVLATWQ